MLKNSMKFAAVAFIILSSFVYAGPNRVYNSAEQAAEHHSAVKATVRNYLRDGFELTNNYANAYRYFAQPEGDYEWGTVVYNFQYNAGNYSLETTYATVTVYIQYVASEDGYRVSGFDVTENTAY